MDKKISVIVIIAIVLIVVGAFLIFSNPFCDGSTQASDIVFKTQNFKFFEVDLPEGSNFSVKNEVDGMKYYQNTGKYSDDFSGIILTENMSDSLIGDASESILNSSSEKIYAVELKNNTVYKYVSVQDGADIVLIGMDLNLLKETADSIKIKNLSDF